MERAFFQQHEQHEGGFERVLITNIILLLVVVAILVGLGFSPGQAFTPWMRGIVGLLVILATAGYFLRGHLG